MIILISILILHIFESMISVEMCQNAKQGLI